MTDQPSLKQFLAELSSYSETDGSPTSSNGQASAPPIGRVLWEVYPDIVGTVFEREMRRAAMGRKSVTFEGYYPALGAWSSLAWRIPPVELVRPLHFLRVDVRNRDLSRHAVVANHVDRAPIGNRWHHDMRELVECRLVVER